jgi:hypothetical protein
VILPCRAYRDLVDSMRRGDTGAVLHRAQRVIDELSRDPEQAELVPAVLIMVGGAFAREEHFVEAAAYLERGLDTMDGTASVREIGSGDEEELLLLGLYLLCGRYREVWPRVQKLSEPGRSLEARLGATRAHTALATAFGDFDTAHQLLNTATGLAERLPSHQLSVMVEGDRAIVLAEQGRTLEATSFAMSALALLARPGPGRHLAWARGHAITIATTVARQVATGDGDLGASERLLAIIEPLVERDGRTLDRAQLALARGVVWRESGHLAEAESALDAARRTLLGLGCAPAAALAQREEARLAVVRKLEASAQPLYVRARDEFAALGLTREVAQIDTLLRAGSS